MLIETGVVWKVNFLLHLKITRNVLRSLVKKDFKAVKIVNFICLMRISSCLKRKFQVIFKFSNFIIKLLNGIFIKNSNKKRTIKKSLKLPEIFIQIKTKNSLSTDALENFMI